MPLEKHKVIALTCLFVLAWGALDLLYEVKVSRGRGTGDFVHATADAPAVDLGDLAHSLGFTTAPGKTDASFLAQVVSEPLEKNLRGIVLLERGDRRAEVTSTAGNDTPTLFTRLKTGLYLNFSSEVSDIEDMAREHRSGAPVHLFGFRDPQLAEERILFIQKGALLMEFHIAEGAGIDVERLIQRIVEM